MAIDRIDADGLIVAEDMLVIFGIVPQKLFSLFPSYTIISVKGSFRIVSMTNWVSISMRRI